MQIISCCSWLILFMKKEETESVREELRTDGVWKEIGTSVPKLAGEFFLVTGSGKYFRNVILDPLLWRLTGRVNVTASAGDW